jgi:beta-lactamase regulating signal transducer with metallopeptidase domain
LKAAKTQITPAAFLFILWSFGIVACGVKLGFQLRHARLLRRNSKIIQELWLVREAERVAGMLRLRTTPVVALSAEISAPVVVGIVRPLILLPVRTAGDISHPSLEMILAHEMAHIRRNDPVWSWLCTIIERFFFFHPIFWQVRGEWRMAQEMACDESAIRATGASATDYATMLLDVVSRNSRPPTAMALSMAETKQRLKRRIMAMKNIQSISRTKMTYVVVILALLTLVGIVPWRVVAQNAPDGNERADELSELKAENARLKAELRQREEAAKAEEQKEQREKELSLVQDKLEAIAAKLQKKYDDLKVLQTKYTDVHPLIVQRLREIEALKKAELPLSIHLEELEKGAGGPGNLGARAARGNRQPKGGGTPVPNAKTSQYRALLQQVMELAEQRLEYAKKKLEAGVGTQEQFLSASRDLYGTKRELARLEGDKAQLRRIAQDEMQVLNQQLKQIQDGIKTGNFPAGSELEVRQLLLRLRREALSLE